MADELFTVRVPVNVSPSMAAWLESRARAEERSVAAVVRRLIGEAAGRVWASPGEGDVSLELAGVVREGRSEHPSVGGKVDGYTPVQLVAPVDVPVPRGEVSRVDRGPVPKPLERRQVNPNFGSKVK